MRKWEEELKEHFLELLSDGKAMKQEDVIGFIEPHVEFDPEKEYERFLVREAAKFCASFKENDPRGHKVRKIFSLEIDGQLRWASVDHVIDLEVLRAQKKQLIRKWLGLQRSIKKIDKRIVAIGGQATLFDTLFDIEMEKTERIAEAEGAEAYL